MTKIGSAPSAQSGSDSMTLSRKAVSFAALLTFYLHGVQADGLATCASLVLSFENLTQSECSNQDGLTVFRYLGKTTSSPYATEFDQRSVLVARGLNAKAVRAAAGIDAGPKGMSLNQSRLARPLAEDQIARRSPLKASVRHREWTIMTERVQYAAQGRAPGFVVDCATALRSSQRETTAVAECFPLEERQRFLRTLEAIR